MPTNNRDPLRAQAVTTVRTQQQYDKNRAWLMAKEGWLKTCASYPELSGSDQAVVMVLSTYLNSESHHAFPALALLAKETNRSPSTVWRSIKKLEKLGLLTVIHSRSRHKPNEYKMALGTGKPKRRSRGHLQLQGKLRTRTLLPANLRFITCELAGRTSEEHQSNLVGGDYREGGNLRSKNKIEIIFAAVGTGSGSSRAVGVAA